MKILWLSHLVPYPPKGGVLQRSYNLLREVSRDHEVYLLAFVQSELIQRMFPDLARGKEEALAALQSFCSRVQFIPIPSEEKPYGKHRLAIRSLFTRDPYAINWLKSNLMCRAAQEWENEFNFDVVHFDTISLAPNIKYFKNTKSVLDHHNIESHMMLRRAALESNWLKKFYFYQEGLKLRQYEKHTCFMFDRHITCSHLDSERLRDIDASLSVEEIPNGVDVVYFSPMNTPELPRNLVFAGGLSWYPNQKAMLFFAQKVWPLLKHQFPDVSMDVIGQNPPKALLELAASDSAFRVHGFVDDVRPYLDRAAIYICPITDGGGTKLKILDALSMGKAIIADPIACEGIEVENGKNVLFSTSIEDYVENIKHLFENPDLRKTLGISARQLATEQYAFSNIGKKLSCIYESL